MDDRFTIRFEPDGVAVEAAGPTPLWMAALSAGVIVDQPCGAAGSCGNCRVRVLRGAPSPTEADRASIGDADLASGWRLACQVTFAGPALVEVPATARSMAGKAFGEPLPAARLCPPVRSVVVDVLAPVVGTASSALDRLGAALGRPPRALTGAPAALDELTRVLEGRGRVRVAMAGDRLVAAQSGGGSWLGLAADLGSTTIAAALVDLASGATLASGARLNPQVALGADVISRIQCARDQTEGLARLTAAIRGGLAALVNELCGSVGRSTGDLAACTVVGNPTMLHTWAGVSPASLGEAPYAGAWTGELECRAPEVALPAHPEAVVRALPMVGSHVGADAVAAILATDLDQASGPALLVDLGTNTEMVLAARGRLFACSAAAGPAFEGATIGQGMRAAPGAIDAVSVAPDGRLQVNSIGGVEPAGLCGSGLVDAVAELRRVGLVSASGLLASADDPPPGCPAELRARLGTVRGQRAFVLALGSGPGASRGVALTAGDIRQVQLAKASIGAGVLILCREAGIDPGALDRVLIAGAFGSFLRKASLHRIGLVPPLEATRVEVVGNAAGVGARLALLDARGLDRARAIAAATTPVELAASVDYPQLFLDALAFPPA